MAKRKSRHFDNTEFKSMPKCKFYVFNKRKNGGINIKCANKINLAGCFANSMDLSRNRKMYPRRANVFVTPLRPVVSDNVRIYDDGDVKSRYCRPKDISSSSVALAFLKADKSHKWGNKHKITTKNNKIAISVMRKSQ
jgi:hypothetical protein